MKHIWITLPIFSTYSSLDASKQTDKEDSFLLLELSGDDHASKRKHLNARSVTVGVHKAWR